jgi:hypothetical protein
MIGGIMASPSISCRELDLLVREAAHVHNEHARATADSVRRKQGARLLELEARFERTLAEEVPDEELRRAWREYLHGRGPAPSEPRPIPMVLFRGRSEAGSEVLVRETPRGELGIEVDGALVNRTVDSASVPNRTLEGGVGLLRIEGLGDFRETFVAPPDAVEALRAWTDDPRGEPPWPKQRELAADGLVDRTFALTRRGRRALGRAD